MKKFFLFLLLITGIATLSQTGDKIRKGKGHRQLISGDSVINKLQQLKDMAAANRIDSDQTREKVNVSMNVDGILQLQKEQKEKQKKAALIRIGIGVTFLVILIIGWRRRRK
jgi:hypothetical protein